MVPLDCLRTRLRCTAPVRTWFPFVGPNGGFLSPGEEFDLPGDIRSLGAGGVRDRVIRKSLEACLEKDLIEIVQTPPPVLYDATLNRSRQLALDNDAFETGEVCWEGVSS